MKNRLSKKVAVIVSFIALIYVVFAYVINGSIFRMSEFPYYNYLVKAFFAGQVNVQPKTILDLSLFEGKWFLYWGPSPIVFISPFFLFSGVFSSDVFYTLVAGVLNVVLFTLVLYETKKYFRLKIRDSFLLGTIVSFALISPNFYLALAGRIWHTNQIIAVLYLLLYLFWLLRFLNTNLRISNFILAVVFFNLAWMSRYSLATYGLLFLFVFWVISQTNLKLLLQAVFSLAAISGIFLLLFFWYNFARFHNPFEFGYQYHIAHPRYRSLVEAGKTVSLAFFLHNFRIYFLNHLPLSVKKPFVLFSQEGNSIVSVYPVLGVLLFMLKRKHFFKSRKQTIYLCITGVISLVNLGLLLSFLGTGWRQFGTRYFFDLIPLLYIGFLFVSEKVPTSVWLSLIWYGLIVNSLGALAFYGKL